MGDPYEGVAADGTIVTGARRDRVPLVFEPVLQEAEACVRDAGASLYIYGSVANGSARLGASDVDLLSIGLRGTIEVGERLTALFADLSRGVEIAAAEAGDYEGDSDEAYGNRVFLRHYCVHLAGADPSRALPAYPADARAARGFNGDLGRHLERWRGQDLSGAGSAAALGVRAARKTLLAVAGMVSIHDQTWTTDRSEAVRRWSEIEPALAPGLARLHDWSAGDRHATVVGVEQALDESGICASVLDRFAALIGLWG